MNNWNIMCKPIQIVYQVYWCRKPFWLIKQHWVAELWKIFKDFRIQKCKNYQKAKHLLRWESLHQPSGCLILTWETCLYLHLTEQLIISRQLALTSLIQLESDDVWWERSTIAHPVTVSEEAATLPVLQTVAVAKLRAALTCRTLQTAEECRLSEHLR